MSTTALATRGATIDVPRQPAIVELPLGVDRLSPGREGRTLLDVTIRPTSGSRLTLGRFQLVDADGRPVPMIQRPRGCDTVHGWAAVAPGDYSIRVFGRGRSTGEFQATVGLAGDVDGDAAVDSGDLDAIRSRLGTRAEDGLGDVDGDHLVTRRDLRIARRNLDAADESILFDVRNQTGVFENSQVNLSFYGMVPSLSTTENPSGWSYFDASGTPHALTSTNAVVPSFTLDAAPNGIKVANNQVIISGQVYIGLEAPVSLSVNRLVTSYQVTSGGSGYTSAPTVTVSGGGGSGASATATIANGVVTAVTVQNTGNGYSSPPTVAFSGGGGSGAQATAFVMIPGVAAPSPSNSGDPNNAIYWDFAEMTLNSPAPNINADLSQVDQVGISHTLQLTPKDALNPNGSGVFATRPDLLAEYAQFIKNAGQTNPAALGFLKLISDSGDHGPYRILAPSNYVKLHPTDPLASYYNDYINSVFTIGETVTIQVPNSAPQTPAVLTPVVTNGQITAVNIINAGSGYAFAQAISFADGVGTGATATAAIDPSSGAVTSVTVTNPGSNYTASAQVVLNAPPPVSFTGTVVASGGSTIYRFTTTDPSQAGVNFNVYSPFTPPAGDPDSSQATWEVFANAGVFADNTLQFNPGTNYGQAQILGNIENQLVSAMNRGVATQSYSVWTDGPYYPAGSIANWYAAFLHQDAITIDGHAYGFAFDDQGGNSTDLSVNNPKALTITLSPWKAVNS